jgi:hypothetical protein
MPPRVIKDHGAKAKVQVRCLTQNTVSGEETSDVHAHPVSGGETLKLGRLPRRCRDADAGCHRETLPSGHDLFAVPLLDGKQLPASSQPTSDWTEEDAG